MKKLLLALGVLALICSPAMAARNAGGAMVVHTDNAVVYSAGWDYCGQNPLPATCADLVTQSTKEVEVAEAVVWIVGAFPEGSSPGVTAYQFGVYHNLGPDYFTAWGPCGPGALEIPDATYPFDSGTGTAVAYSAPVYPNYIFKMYWLAIVGQAGATFSTGSYPHGTDGAAWADDGMPPLVDGCFQFGSLGWDVAGQNTCPVTPIFGACCLPNGSCEYVEQTACTGVFHENVPCEQVACDQPLAACCFVDGTCADLLETDCAAQSGVWAGYPTTCATYDCPQVLQACCFADASCQDLLPDACAAQGGTAQGQDTVCASIECPPPPAQWACCIEGACQMLTEADCATAGGTFYVDQNCDQVTCPPVATRPSTWGQIKANYR